MHKKIRIVQGNTLTFTADTGKLIAGKTYKIQTHTEHPDGTVVTDYLTLQVIAPLEKKA